MHDVEFSQAGGGARAVLISVVIPCWKDWALALALCERVKQFSQVVEMIVALSPESDAEVRRFEEIGVKVVRAAAKGRGAQMNAGAAGATGDVLLFQHCDTDLQPTHLESLVRAFSNERIVGGAFHRAFDERHPHLRWLEPLERLHCNLFGSLYGDQSIFVRREHFERIGGYADFPLLEDVDFSGRLRRSGPVLVLDPPISTSARKHLKEGSWRTTLRNIQFLILYRLGISPHTLYARYYAD